MASGHGISRRPALVSYKCWPHHFWHDTPNIKGALASQITSLNRSSWRRLKKTSKLRVTGLCAGISSVTTNLSIYLRVYSLHHNVLPTLQSIPVMTNGPLYPITQDSSCHGQHTMPRNPWSFPWPVPHSCVCMNVCVLQWRKVCVVVL